MLIAPKTPKARNGSLDQPICSLSGDCTDPHIFYRGWIGIYEVVGDGMKFSPRASEKELKEWAEQFWGLY